MAETEKSQTSFAGLIFDCDGVMIDSLQANRYFYNQILAWFGREELSPEEEKFAFMATARQALMAMLPENLHDRIDEATKSALDYSRDILPRIRLMPGLVDFLEEAGKRKLRMAIDTNRTAEGIQRVLDFFGLADYFNPVISTTLTAPKPSPEGAFEIRASWNLPSDRILFIGDSENDMLTARNASLQFAAFRNPQLEARLHVKSFAELGQLLWAESRA